MTTLTIPKQLARKGDLVLISREEYEILRARAVPEISLSPRERKEFERGRKEVAAGEYSTLDELEYELAHTRRKPGKK